MYALVLLVLGIEVVAGSLLAVNGGFVLLGLGAATIIGLLPINKDAAALLVIGLGEVGLGVAASLGFGTCWFLVYTHRRPGYLLSLCGQAFLALVVTAIVLLVRAHPWA